MSFDIFYKKYGFTNFIYPSDFVDFIPVFKDVQTGRFISREVAERLLETEPERVQIDYRARAKVDLPEFGIRRGQFVSNEAYEDLAFYTHKHNQAIGLQEELMVTFDEAFDKLQSVESKYIRGEISSSEYGSWLYYG
jgi:hypothetical protein